jgi:hypothetical protein
MPNNQMMGFIAALLLVIVVLLAVDINQRHHTVGDSLHEAVQDMKDGIKK